MKKSNVILQAAIASALLAMAGGAQAGTLSGTATFATEIAGPTASTALAIRPVPVVYTFNTPGGIVINPGGIIYAYLRVSGSAGTPIIAIAPTNASLGLSAGIAGIVATVGALSGDSTTLRITLTNTATVNQTIGVGGTLTWTPTVGSISGVNTALATAGGTISVQGSVASSSAGTAMNTGTALLADLDNGLSNTLAIATSAEAVTAAVAASSGFAVVETQKIDLTATSPGSRFTAPGGTLSNANATGLLNLGSVTFTNTAGTQAVIDGTTDYVIATQGTATTQSGTVTGSFKTGSVAFLASDLACTTGIAAGSNGVLNTALTTFTFTAGTLPTTAVAEYVCLTAPATTGAIPVTTPTASFTFTKTTTTDAADTASGTLYALTQNGSTVDVRSYIPAVTVGYTSFERIINSGGVAATVTGQWLYENGTTSTAATLITPALAIGGATTLTSTQIEAALGAPTATIGNNRPRLRLTAATNGLQAQWFFLNPSNDFSTMHGAD